MNISEIRRLIKLVESSDINELEVTDGEFHVRIVKRAGNNEVTFLPAQTQIPQTVLPPPQDEPATTKVPEESVELLEVTSPMVGTFYLAPAPEAPLYVQVGDKVNPGKVLCIIEAMKLMNEIECDLNGTIVEISVENGQPVEFGQLLFKIDPF